MVEVKLNEKVKDYAGQLVEFVMSLEGELATEALRYSIEAKRQEFIDWLTTNHLLEVLDYNRTKTQFEWECFKFISSVIEMFDSALHKFHSTDFQWLEMERRHNYWLCSRMAELCNEFKERIDEFK